MSKPARPRKAKRASQRARGGGVVMWLYRVGPWLRRLGLGSLVAFGRRRFSRVEAPFEAEVDGLHLVGATVADGGYVRELLAGRESFMTELFVRSLRPGMRVADVGAYLGFLTLQAARRVGPDGHVYAFEPNPRAFALLEESVERNGFSDRVTAIPRAVSDRAGMREFFIAEGSDTSGLFPQESATRAQVESVRLDDLFDGTARWDVIKLDVEGAEVAAIAGMKETILRSQSRLFVECNPTALDGAGTTVDALIGSLLGLGLEVAVIDESTRQLEPLGKAKTLEPWVNLYCEPIGQPHSTGGENIE